MSKFKYKGYAGKILRVNLTSGSIIKEDLPEGLALKYLGGIGFATRILWDETGPDTKPLSPENRLVIATGPVNGAYFPQTGRLEVAARSPLTGVWGSANTGGAFAPELKYAGYDMIIVTGKSEKPVYLYIDDNHVELMDASRLWGKTVSETTDMIREKHGDDRIKVAAIGPAGENMVKMSCIIFDYYHAAGRTGMGAVMGSKNLKAIAVRGTGSVEVYDYDEWKEVMEYAWYKMTVEWGELNESSLGMYGTPSLVEITSAIGRLPTRNHSTGVYEDADKISGERMRREFRVKRAACMGCGIQCKYLSKVPYGPYKTLTGGPEYETIMAFGSNCGNPHLESVIHANWLCNEYSLDTISTGCTIAFAIECYERGILSKEDTGGLELTWGNHEAIVQLVRDIAFRKGFGDILAEGSRRAAEVIGRGSWRYAIHVKGLEVSGQDGRSHQSSGLTHATAARGADHLTSLSCLEEQGYEETAKERYPQYDYRIMVDPLSPQYKGELIRDLEDFYCLVDSMIICKYSTMWPPIFYFEDVAKIIPPLTGMQEYADVKYVRKVAARIANLRKAFNVRLGLTRKDDTLPDRFLKEPMPAGPAKGRVCQLDKMLDEYYEKRGWDIKTGLPKRKTLEELELDDVAEQLGKAGKLPATV